MDTRTFEQERRDLLVTQPERVPRDILGIMVAAAALPGVDRASYTMLRTVTTLCGWPPNLMLGEEVARLAVPTLFLWGDRDAFALPVRGQTLAERMPHARFEVLKDAGHVPYLDQPERVIPTSSTSWMQRNEHDTARSDCRVALQRPDS
jgi:pimeloyl-ACP methyl ester carboxylesterase